ncbi:nose resistant to fluoxetine protein 6-like isoform X1 [Clytia hemisphaerica]|uniref:nose resistant to fluoxetine protein 6-like isoform X1 n=1 Tax=Clytia hemisphaerica TaxID=252671 RepID=UPI0034D64F5E
MIRFLSILCTLLTLSSCQHQYINHRPIADRIAYHVTKNQNFMQQLKYFKEFQFDFSQVDSTCIQYPKLNCLKELLKISQGPDVGKYLDALGKPPTGLFEGNVNWIGNYEECMSIPNTHYCDMKNVAVKVLGRTIPLSTYGVCIQKKCDIYDVTKLLNSTVNCLNQYLNTSFDFLQIKPADKPAIANPSYPVPVYSKCFDNSTGHQYTSGAYVMIVISIIILTLCILGTIAELGLQLVTSVGAGGVQYSDEISSFNKTEQSLSYNASDVSSKEIDITMFRQITDTKTNKLLSFLLCFSLVKNSKSIFNTNVPPGAIASINGIRTFSITWVILGHLIIEGTQSDNPVSFLKWGQRFSFQVIANAFVSVDSFFVLSGLLVGYLSFKRFETHGKLPLLRYYLHRYIRLTASYLYLIFFVVYLYPLLGNGVRWIGTPEKNCHNMWWTNILYINNIYPTDASKACYGVSWYLANDMQFYIISPLIMWAMYRFKIVGVLLTTGVFLFEYLLANGLIIHLKKASPIVAQAIDPSGGTFSFAAYQQYIYFKPWTRIGPYILGIVLGYVLFYKKTIKGRFAILFYFLGWLVAIGLGFAVVYGPFNAVTKSWNEAENLIYGMSFRLVWAIAICWVIYACHNGYGSIINDFLGWKVFIPLSRLTYGVYLIHFYVIDYYFATLNVNFHFTEVTLAFAFIPIIVTSYFLSYIVAVCIEYPVFNLEKLLLKL